MLMANSLDDLTAAAALLGGAGRADPDRCHPSVRIHCLAAAEHLQSLVAMPAHVDIQPDAVETAIRTAMTLLGRLPAEVFASPTVLAAAEAAQTALERYEDARAD